LSAAARNFGFLFLLLFLSVIHVSAAPASGKKIIFDTDPGTDDAMALMLALHSPELDVRAITVVPGNTTAKQGLENALRMVSLANRATFRRCRRTHPLFQKLITAEFWHGRTASPTSSCRPASAKWTRASART